MKLQSITLALVSSVLVACGGGGGDDGEGGDDSPGTLFPAKPECEGEAVAALMGQHQMVIASMAIGGEPAAFDLDGDGLPDNQLAVLGALGANEAIADAFTRYDVVLPIEFFDMAEPGADDCVKFAVYVGAYRQDRDGDGFETARAGGDCNDGDDAIGPGAEEVPDNRIDDDCDGLADEVVTQVETDAGPGTVEEPSADDTDEDGDGVSLAAGDCDDTRDDVSPELVEICGDGLDNDCDGAADWGMTEGGAAACSPFDDSPDEVPVDPVSVDDSGKPLIAFASGEVVEEGGKLLLRGGPAFFSVVLPIQSGVNVDLRITGATIEAELVMTPAGWSLQNGRLGGVIDAVSADRVRGLEVEQIGISGEDSLLDALFANALGALLGLPIQVGEEAGEADGCHTPDIDVDLDGLEAFCDATEDDDEVTVDKCVDGDGSVVMDEGSGESIVHCTEAKDADGNYRFVDGVSVFLEFDAVPAVLPASL